MDALYVFLEFSCSILISSVSLILCTVACSESFPFLIQMAYSGNSVWLPILVSIASLTIFAEIIPQYIMPRRAIWWGYWCAPVIWASMLLTGIITWPIARFLDSVDDHRNQRREQRDGKTNDGIFRNDELCTLIKYHERSEKHGGNVSSDTARIMVGALHLDNRQIRGELGRLPDIKRNSIADIEKADLVVVQGLVVKWSAVKTVRIDEVVDDNFIEKVNSWSYSRIPVIGGNGLGNIVESSAPSPPAHDEWGINQIFGFLHIKASYPERFCYRNADNLCRILSLFVLVLLVQYW
jgi:metal transporter CNNM